VSGEGDAENYFGSLTAGTNFWDDRGNIAVNVEYAKQDAFFASDRPGLAKQGAFVLVDNDPGDAPNGSDGIPDRLYYNDVRTTSVANGGLVLFSNAMAPATVHPCGVDNTGARYSCPYIFQSDGSLVPQTGDRIGLAPNGSFQGGNGSNNRERDALGIFPKLDRVSVNVFGNLAISDSFKPYIEAKYVRTESLRQGQPAFFQGGTMGDPYQFEAGGYNRETFSFANPFLSAAAQATIVQARANYGLAAPTAATRFSLRRNMLDLGNRAEDATRETKRIVLGVGGELGSNWNYDVSVNYGQFDEDTIVQGNLNIQRFLLAMDSVRDGGGVIRCRSQIDPAAAFSYGGDLADRTLAADVTNCIPMNPFGDGSITPEMRKYLAQDTTSVGQIKEFVASATVSGDTEAWFSLPAGPIGVALGVEHRTEENSFHPDEIVQSGITFYNALPDLTAPKFRVNEVFTEFRIPLLKDKTAFKDLTLNAAARYADYNGATGGVLAYNGGLEYAPIESLRFRGGVARAVRAPNLVDLYSAQGQNFSLYNDPCAANNIGTGSPTRAANCAAAGIPGSYNYLPTSSLSFLSGGNPDLKEETSDSFTLGLVFQPNFLQGFSFSADYFDIEIKNVITAPSAQGILDACYDAPNLNNQFCSLFQRWGAAGGPGYDPNDPATFVSGPYVVQDGSLIQTSLNYAKSKSRGIDFEAGYNTDLGAGKLNTRLIYTRTLQRDDFLNPAFPNEKDQVLLELGDPKDAFNFDASFDVQKFKIGYQMRYIGRMVLNAAEDTYSVNGNPPQNLDYAYRRNYPAVMYHDVHASYDVTDDFTVSVGIDNVKDKMPPLGLTGTGGGSSMYDIRGRFFYAGLKYDFAGK